jgi:hypothetical protein
LDHLGLAFQDLGIDVQELGDYVKNVAPVPYPSDVPAYPVGRETHFLNLEVMKSFIGRYMFMNIYLPCIQKWKVVNSAVISYFRTSLFFNSVY